MKRILSIALTILLLAVCVVLSVKLHKQYFYLVVGQK
jgi:heme exporter protein D